MTTPWANTVMIATCMVSFIAIVFFTICFFSFRDMRTHFDTALMQSLLTAIFFNMIFMALRFTASSTLEICRINVIISRVTNTASFTWSAYLAVAVCLMIYRKRDWLERSKTYERLFLASGWVVSVIMSIPIMVVEFVPDPTTSEGCSAPSQAAFWTYWGYYIFTVVIALVCTGCIFVRLRQNLSSFSASDSETAASKTTTGHSKSSSRTARVAYMRIAISISLMVGVLNIPACVMAIFTNGLRDIEEDTPVQSAFIMISYILLTLQGFLIVLVYSINRKLFKRAWDGICCRAANLQVSPVHASAERLSPSPKVTYLETDSVDKTVEMLRRPSQDSRMLSDDEESV